MDLSQALAAIQNSELSNRGEIYEVISSVIQERDSSVEKLTLNNGELLKQKKRKEQEVSALQQTLRDTLELSSGDEAELKAKLEELKSLSGKYQEVETRAKTAEEKAAEYETKMAQLEKRSHQQQAAIKAGVDLNAFLSLPTFTDLPTDKLLIQDDGVFVAAEDGSKQAIADYAKTKGDWVYRALYPQQLQPDNNQQNPKPPARTPDGAPNGTGKEQAIASKVISSAGFNGPKLDKSA